MSIASLRPVALLLALDFTEDCLDEVWEENDPEGGCLAKPSLLKMSIACLLPALLLDLDLIEACFNEAREEENDSVCGVASLVENTPKDKSSKESGSTSSSLITKGWDAPLLEDTDLARDDLLPRLCSPKLVDDLPCAGTDPSVDRPNTSETSIDGSSDLESVDLISAFARLGGRYSEIDGLFFGGDTCRSPELPEEREDLVEALESLDVMEITSLVCPCAVAAVYAPPDKSSRGAKISS